MDNNVELVKKTKFKKKFLSYFFKFLSLLLTVVVALFIFHFAYEYTDKDLQNNSIVGLALIENRIYSDGTATQEHLDIIKAFFDDIPPEIKQKYTEQNWLIILSETVPTALLENTISFTSSNYDHAVYSKLGGLTVPDGKIIYLNTNTNTYDEFLENLAHEFGHCIDFFAGYPSYSEESTKMYQLYSTNDNIYNDYESSNTTEFFASAYKEYVLHPSQTKEKAPELYLFMKSNEDVIINTCSVFVNVSGFMKLLIYNIKGITNQL